MAGGEFHLSPMRSTTELFLPPGAVPLTGDLADEGSLVTAMEGVEKVFLLSSPHPDAISWHRNAIDAARRTGAAAVHPATSSPV